MSFPAIEISKVANFINGFAFKPEDWENSGLPIIRIQNLTDPTKPYNFTTKKVPKKYLVSKGDILVSWSATIDVFEWEQDDAILNQHIFKVEFDHDIVDKHYFKKALQKTIFDLSRYAHGSTMKHVVKKDFESHKIPLPPLDDQKRIAYLLGKVEGLIAQRKQHLQQLDDLLKSVFLEMFGDPVRNDKGWDISPLGLISEVQGGLQVTSKRHTNPIEVPYLRVANVYRDRLDLTEVKNLRVTETELERVRLKKGDLLIVEGHGNPEEIGRSAVWDGSIENCVHQNHLIRVRVDASKLTELYTSHFINSSGGRAQMFRAGKTTSGLNTISSRNVKETEVPTPPIPLQNQFATIVEKVESIKSHYQRSLDDLENLYGALSQKAFKGELDLSRVPLPPDSTEAGVEEKLETDEPQPTTDTFDLPAPSDLATLHSTEGRNALLDQWLTVWLEHLNDKPFSPQPFMDAAQQRLWELTEEDALEWELGITDYDQIKAWASKSLDQERLAQTYDNANNRVQLKAVSNR